MSSILLDAAYDVLAANYYREGPDDRNIDRGNTVVTAGGWPAALALANAVSEGRLVEVPTDDQTTETADWFRSLGAEEQECCRPKHGMRVEDLGGFNSWEWEYAPALKLALGVSRHVKVHGIKNEVLPGYLYRWADRPGYWLVLPDEHPLGDAHEVVLTRQPKTRGDVRRLVASLKPDSEGGS